MILEDNFYKIEQISYENNHIGAVVVLEPEHPIYSGHFPAQAVVPGVCTLKIVKECISHALKKKCNYKSIKECKFTAALIPFAGLKLNLEFDVLEDMQIAGRVRRVNDGQVIIKLKAKLF